jgi:methionyl-tRNA synthetase
MPSFGNFVNRTLKFVSSQYDGILPDNGDAPGPYSLNDDLDPDFVSDINTLLKEYTDAMENVKLRLGLQIVMLISNRGNVYLQSSVLGKALMTDDPTRCARVVSRAINLIYVLSALIYPFMPATSESILVQLNAPARVVPASFAADILAAHHIGKPEHLFKRIDEKVAETFRQRFGGVESALGPATDTLKATGGTSKRKPAAKKGLPAADGVLDTGFKTPQVLALEARVAEQRQVVRSLKSQTPKTKELDDQIASAVDDLKRLKAELAVIGQ